MRVDQIIYQYMLDNDNHTAREIARATSISLSSVRRAVYDMFADEKIFATGMRPKKRRDGKHIYERVFSVCNRGGDLRMELIDYEADILSEFLKHHLLSNKDIAEIYKITGRDASNKITQLKIKGYIDVAFKHNGGKCYYKITKKGKEEYERYNHETTPRISKSDFRPLEG